MSFPKYPKYKDSGVEWLGEVPGHWEITPTKRIFKLVAEPAPMDNDYELLSIYTEIGVRPRKELEAKGNKATTTDGYWMVQKGDIIVNKLLAWMGAIGISEYTGVTSPAYDILRKTRPIEPKFYDYLFRCGICFTEFRRYSRGIMDMRLRLYFEDLGQIIMPLPPCEEQQSIVSFLNHETTKIDALIAEQERLIELLKEKRQAVISHAVTKGLNPNVKMKPSGIEWLGDVPEHWEVKPLRRFNCKVQTGPFGSQLHADEYISGGTPVINPTHMVNGNIIPSDAITVSDEVLERLSHQRLQLGDVIFSRRGELGRCAMVSNSEVGWLCGTGSMILRLQQSEYAGSYLSLFLSLPTVKQYFESFSIGTVMDSLSSDTLLAMPLLVPPLGEQKDIVRFLQPRATELGSLLSEAEGAIQLFQERRTALISAAVTGKIDVRNLVKDGKA